MEEVMNPTSLIYDARSPIASQLLIQSALILVAFCLINLILKLLVSIIEPVNYELDMTTDKFTEYLCEVDNSFKTIGSMERKQNIESNDDDKQQTLSGSANLVYPNGWLPIIESCDVACGTIRSTIFMGRDLIVTRSMDGKVDVLDAYCPHMGVHIGIGGGVVQRDGESCVQCPFHGWVFRSSDGRCVDIPYQASGRLNIPKNARIRIWNSIEVDNFIYVWHHIDNEPPQWNLEAESDIESNNITIVGRSCHLSNFEMRDVLENGADFNHFDNIHNDLFFFGSNLMNLKPLKKLQKYIRHHFKPNWDPVVEDESSNKATLGRKNTHIAKFKLQSWISIMSMRLFDITIYAKQEGPGRVHLKYNSPWYGSGLLTMNFVPIAGRRSKYIQHIYTKQTLFQAFMGKVVFYGEIKMLERDLIIWSHKKNVNNAVLVSEDKVLRKFRLWYSQFFKRSKPIVIKFNNNQDDDNNFGGRNDCVENIVSINNNNNNNHFTCVDRKRLVDLL